MLRKSIHFILFGAGFLIGYIFSKERSSKKNKYHSQDQESRDEILLEKEGKIQQLQSRINALLNKGEKSEESKTSKKVRADDLTVIEGIGPKTEELLNKNGIFNYSQLAKTPLQKLRAILSDAGSVYLRHNPDSWAEQARIAESRSSERKK